jgi:hypothetical protein
MSVIMAGQRKPQPVLDRKSRPGTAGPYLAAGACRAAISWSQVTARRDFRLAPVVMTGVRLAAQACGLDENPAVAGCPVKSTGRLVAYRRERLADDLLVGERSVHPGGVEEGDAPAGGVADGAMPSARVGTGR